MNAFLKLNNFLLNNKCNVSNINIKRQMQQHQKYFWTAAEKVIYFIQSIASYLISTLLVFRLS